MDSKFTKKQEKELRRRLARESKLVWDELTSEEKEKAFAFGDRYKTFLDHSKTERQAVNTIQRFAEENGFHDIDKAGTTKKLYKVHRGKNIALAVLGSNAKTLKTSGIHLVGSHIDAPRLDLKQNPLYENENLAFLKTHYYGGIKKYQWLARPLAIHGVVLRGDGTRVDLQIGDGADDPVFTIADLLPHLSHKFQADKKVSVAFEAERLNVLVGSIPLGDKETKDRFKLAVLSYLADNHGIVEEDFISAELEIVPAGKARDIGWDRSLVGAYGQDDRVCAYASLEAICNIRTPEKTAIALFVDKEEIGSEGSTSARSRFLEDFVADLLEISGHEPMERTLRSCLMSSCALSADVAGALDPDYPEVHEKLNAARMGYGVCVTKFTGSGGKYGSSDANAEFISEIRQIFNKNNVIWQAGELGKVDEGGGGTIAKFLAVYGMDVLDCGTPLLSTHSPFEIASKADIYMTYKAYLSFFN